MEDQAGYTIMSNKDSPDTLRHRVKVLCYESGHVHDIEGLLDIVGELSGFLITIQEQEKDFSTLVSKARLYINSCKEQAKTDEIKGALRLNGTGIPMNRAEKLAYLDSAELRADVVLAQTRFASVDNEYKNIKGFKNAMSEYIMTIRQRVKNLQIESATPNENIMND